MFFQLDTLILGNGIYNNQIDMLYFNLYSMISKLNICILELYQCNWKELIRLWGFVFPIIDIKIMIIGYFNMISNLKIRISSVLWDINIFNRTIIFDLHLLLMFFKEDNSSIGHDIPNNQIYMLYFKLYNMISKKNICILNLFSCYLKVLMWVWDIVFPINKIKIMNFKY